VLLRLGLSAEAFADLDDLTPRALQSLGRLVRELHQFSVVVVPSDSTKAELITSLKGCDSAELAQALQLLLTRSDVIPALPPLERAESPSELRAWRRDAELVVLRELQLELLEAEGPLPPAPEAQDIERVGSSAAMKALKRSWMAQIDADTHRDQAWDRRFSPYVRRRPKVKLVEEHIGQDLDSALAEEAGPAGRSTKGCVWFLERLEQSGVPRVAIATSARSMENKGIDPQDFARRLAARFPSMTVELWLTPHRDDVHRRLVVFEGWAGFELHKGTASFDGAQLTAPLGSQPNLALLGQVEKDFKRYSRILPR
jgi:hypothetical protein